MTFTEESEFPVRTFVKSDRSPNFLHIVPPLALDASRRDARRNRWKKRWSRFPRLRKPWKRPRPIPRISKEDGEAAQRLSFAIRPFQAPSTPHCASGDGSIGRSPISAGECNGPAQILLINQLLMGRKRGCHNENKQSALFRNLCSCGNILASDSSVSQAVPWPRGTSGIFMAGPFCIRPACHR